MHMNFKGWTKKASKFTSYSCLTLTVSFEGKNRYIIGMAKWQNETEHGIASPKRKYQQEESKEKIGDEQESNTKNSILNPRYVGY